MKCSMLNPAGFILTLMQCVYCLRNGLFCMTTDMYDLWNVL